MIGRILAAAIAAAATTFALTPAVAFARDGAPPYDATPFFVTPFDPGAFGENSHKALILSPYGTSRRIECQSFHGQTSNCVQHLPDGQTNALIRLSPLPAAGQIIREVWAYNPLSTGSAG
ncbi:hypothetical protein AAI421_09030 [Rhodococcus aetherivorans]|uniref:hypothetical protein n=1 Tax=Rhodococcus TaxID=1827 RepID=UPI000622D1C9|nr:MULTISPECIES: hypothetical protein [Rhodococcus]AKE89961.1 hypothetical protein AAT18_12750 [Rhodococcus aetherivorans]MBP2211500.1 hypothetical protein [Rhodococcus ruber]